MENLHYVGFWHNQATSNWVLTVDSRTGTILSTFLILFLSFIGSRIWVIVKWALHVIGTFQRNKRRQSQRKSGDEIDRKGQLILRNGENVQSVLWMLALLWSTRHTRMLGHYPTMSTLVGIIVFVAWTSVTFFIPLALKEISNEVLLLPQKCGFLNVVEIEDQIAASAAIAPMLAEAVTHQELCYENKELDSSNSLESLSCGSFSVERIPFIVTNAKCPFPDPDICISTNSTPIKIDTGYINSNTHLGLNTAPEDSVEIRLVRTCSPLALRKEVVLDGQIGMYLYGKNHGSPNTLNFSEIDVTEKGFGRFGTGYSTRAFSYDPAVAKNPNDWIPISNLSSPDMDAKISLIFLLKIGLHPFPVYDPWFRATKDVSARVFDQVPIVAYTAEEKISALACTEQIEWCNFEKRACIGPTSLASAIKSIFDAINGIDKSSPLFANERLHDIILHILGFDTVFKEITEKTQLEASKTTISYVQTRQLPVDHWRTEIERWTGVNLSLLQQRVLMHVRKQGKLAKMPLLQTNSTWDHCSIQRVRDTSGKSANFNAAGLMAVLIVGALLLLVGTTLEKMYGSTNKQHSSARRQWKADEILNLEVREDYDLTLEQRQRQDSYVELTSYPTGTRSNNSVVYNPLPMK